LRPGDIQKWFGTALPVEITGQPPDRREKNGSRTAESAKKSFFKIGLSVKHSGIQ
jgi:hypothetical protein